MLKAVDYATIANEFSTAAQISAAVLAYRQSRTAQFETGLETPRNCTEEKLQAIWARTLLLPRVGIHDDFFELGGSSLLSVELLRQVIEEFGAEHLTLTAVLEAPSVAQFAKMLSEAKKNFRYLVPLRAAGSRPPIFCVHGAGGNVLSMRNLAMNLPADQPFWGLQAKGLDGTEPLESVQDSAALYVNEIKIMQPEGPYYIGGGSYGGLVAYEMARQLRAQGNQVGMLALFDAYNVAFGTMISKPRKMYCMARFTAKRAAVKAGKLVRSPVAKWPEIVGSSSGALVRHGRKLFGKATNETQPLPPGPETAEGDETGLTDTLIRVRDASMRAADRYVPGPYEGDVTIFAAATRVVEPYEDPYLGWRPLVKGKIEVQTIPGDHITMGDEPAFGRALDRALAQAQAGLRNHM